MYSLNKGDCEHCGRDFHYLLTNAAFGDFSYAYCDSCGTLATVRYDNRSFAGLPPAAELHRQIDKLWEPLLRRCECGGRFHIGSSPRCVHCNSVLSPQYAASYIERNLPKRQRGWHWPGSWFQEYCLAIEDPRNPGRVRQLDDPLPHPGQ
ncbi:MAG TPA: hypothetical protein VND90_14230 [Terracidiphilus sp.]|nr:hypothetical protein [Terracidiphilus sp.]